MKKDNKALYESIMIAVAREVKKALNEDIDDLTIKDRQDQKEFSKREELIKKFNELKNQLEDVKDDWLETTKITKQMQELSNKINAMPSLMKNVNDAAKRHAKVFQSLHDKNIKYEISNFYCEDNILRLIVKYVSYKDNTRQVIKQLGFDIDMTTNRPHQSVSWYDLNIGTQKLFIPIVDNKEAAEYIANLCKKYLMDKNSNLCKSSYYFGNNDIYNLPSDEDKVSTVQGNNMDIDRSAQSLVKYFKQKYGDQWKDKLTNYMNKNKENEKIQKIKKVLWKYLKENFIKG